MKNIYIILSKLSKKGLLLLSIFIFTNSLVFAQNPCPNTTSSNLITNGDFESCVIGSQANDGFTTDYTYSGTTTCPGGGGTATIGNWSVTTSAATLNGAYANPTGTPGTGNPTPNHYLLVDVDGDTTSKATYSATVSVTSGTTYFFSAWMADINATFTNPPILKFTINGTQVGSLVHVDSLANSNAWQQFFVTWKATTTGTITIEIQNKQPTSAGNDLALDNISFTTGCSSIANLNTLGKTANIIDTLYECDYSFPYSITSGLPSSGYGFIWENSSHTALSGTNNQTSYTFTTAPSPGKYYFCYDTIPGCYRADSFIVSNTISVNLGANQSICPPVAQTLTTIPSLTASGLTYSWKHNGTTIAGATTSSYQATQTGTYSITVTSPSCGNVTSQMVITSPSSPLTGTVTCASGKYQFSATSGTYNTINGLSSVAWYNVPGSGTAFTATPNSVSAQVTSASMATSPGCTIGGLYAQDLYSFNGTVGPTTLPCSSISTTGNTAGYMLLTVYANLTINSIQIVQQNYSTGGTASYAAQILSNSPGAGPYSGSCNCNLDGPNTSGVLSTGPTYTFPQVSSSNPAIRTLNFGTSGTGYALTGSSTGTKYWIGISGSEFGFLSCAAAYPYENVPGSPNPNVIELTEQLIYGGISTQMMGFNIQFSIGTPNPCSRAWVCENTSCPTPVKFLYVNAENTTGGTTINWATASELNNKYFIVQKSTDGINFTNIGTVAGAGTSNSILSYSYTDQTVSHSETYYRIEQVDINGDYTFSDIVAVSSSGNSSINVYPVPVKEGNDLSIDFTSNSSQIITIYITDVVGKSLVRYIKNIEKGANTFTIPTNQLPPALYLIELVSQNGEKTIKRIVVN